MAYLNKLPRGAATIALCFLTALLEGLDLQSTGIAAPGIGAEFRLAPAMMGWVFSAGLVGLLPGAFAGGWLADRVGRKRVLVWAVLLFGVFSFATAHAWDFPSLIGARVLTGLGLGAALPLLIALTSEAADPAMRSTAVSLTYCGVPLGGAIASVIGMQQLASGWRTIFYVGGVVPLGVALVLVFLLRESASFRDDARRQAPADRRIVRLVAQPVLASTLLLWVACFFTLTVLYMLLNWLPSLLIGQGYSRTAAGVVQILFNIGGAAGSVLSGRLIDRERPVLAVGITYAGMLLALAGLGWSASFPLMLVAGFAAGYCAIGAQAVLYARAPALYPTAIRATGVGASVSIGRLGAIAGPLVAGQVLAAGAGVAGVMLSAAPGLVVAAACAWKLSQRANAPATAHAAPRVDEARTSCARR
ncbi:MAG TPA: 3-(3-hydroxy-phenyl)propionate transporter MhpT [Telluria sp.]